MLILPFLGDPELTQLFQQFKLDEPWDSENNAKLLINMPAIYRYSKSQGTPGHTRCSFTLWSRADQ